MAAILVVIEDKEEKERKNIWKELVQGRWRARQRKVKQSAR